MKASLLRVAALVSFHVLANTDGALQATLENELQKIVTRLSAKYNCSFSIGVKSADLSVSVAHGTIDFSTGLEARTSDRYAWGSVTKMLTGASILKLVSQGAFGLDDSIGPLVDPILLKMRTSDSTMIYGSLADLWGASNVSNTTVRQLLSMTSRVPDFDTAVPDFGKHSATDSLRKTLYDKGNVGLSPSELLSLPWVAHNWNGPCKRFMALVRPFCYSSTGFMLLGLILASHAGAASPEEFDLRTLLPVDLRAAFQFPVHGPPKDYMQVHGYDRTSYNMPVKQHNDYDVWNIGGVFSGWTASNIVASADAVADLVWRIYGPPAAIAPANYVDMMRPRGANLDGVSAYGLATCQFNYFTGHLGSKLGVAYGHSGATYGYQSIAAYFPTLRLAMAIATNIETDFQQQPFEALCFAYTVAASHILGKRSRCVFKELKNYYMSGCVCTPFAPFSIASEENASSVYV